MPVRRASLTCVLLASEGKPTWASAVFLVEWGCGMADDPEQDPDRDDTYVPDSDESAQSVPDESRQTASAGQGEPDVLLDVPTLDVDEINLEVENLRAKVSLQAEVLDLVKLNVGADVDLGRVALEIKGVEAKALLKVRLDQVASILERVLTTVDRNPEIVTHLTQGLGEATRAVGAGAGDAVSEVGEGASDAVKEVGAGAGSAVSDVGEGASDAVKEVGEGAGGAVEDVGEGAQSAVNDVGEGAGQATQDVGAAGKGVADEARGIAAEAGETVRKTARKASGAAGEATRTARKKAERVSQRGEKHGEPRRRPEEREKRPRDDQS